MRDEVVAGRSRSITQAAIAMPQRRRKPFPGRRIVRKRRDGGVDLLFRVEVSLPPPSPD